MNKSKYVDAFKGKDKPNPNIQNHYEEVNVLKINHVNQSQKNDKK